MTKCRQNRITQAVAAADVPALAGKKTPSRRSKQLEYPVFMDNEAQPASAKAGITEATNAFCETMEAAGYFVGIYGSTDSTRG